VTSSSRPQRCLDPFRVSKDAVGNQVIQHRQCHAQGHIWIRTMIHKSSSNNDRSEDSYVHDFDDYVHRSENESTQKYTLDRFHPSSPYRMRGVKSIGTKKLGGILVAHPNCTVVLPASIYCIAASASFSPAVSMTSSLIYSSSAFSRSY
jgi:hypothetical protein